MSPKKEHRSTCYCKLAALLLFAVPAPLSAQGLDFVKSHYTKYEYRIPMRDGVQLFTAVYVPKDTSQRYPMLMMRTPYSVRPYGVDNYSDHLGPSARFGQEGYIFVYQDVRGRWMSEGTFVNMRPYIVHKNGPKDVDETSDTYDTIDWLIKHVHGHNGKVGQWGISYPGFYTDCGMIDAHPALRAVSPQAPVTDWFVGDDFHHNGALFLPHLFNFIADFGQPRPKPTRKAGRHFEHGTPDGYQFFLDLGPLGNADERYFHHDIAFWDKVMEHDAYDSFWKSRNIRAHIQHIKPAVLTVGGWFDAENLFGALQTSQRVEATSPKTPNTLVMGPWLHGGWSFMTGDKLGDVTFNAPTSHYFQEQILFPFFEYHLKGKGEFKAPRAWVFETGTNVWRRHDAWPPHNAKPKSLYLRANGRLSFDPPSTPESESAFDQYVSDPAKPVPYIDQIGIGMDPRYMVADQRFAARRPDVLVYQTDVLTEDVTIAGPFRADLHVSTSGTDSDWVVKLIDVYPNDYPDPNPNPAGVHMGNYEQLVRGDVMRGKFRNSYEKPEPFTPGKPTRVTMRLNDIDHTFRTGHRIMVQIQSTWFPLVDRNPQVLEDIYHAKAGDFHKATQRVYRSAEMPSKLTVLVRQRETTEQNGQARSGTTSGRQRKAVLQPTAR
ncbi:MAG TPA: CocE/NonD family hydrolase [Gemmataceae bacterium]|nr:CocE/NonD family hydrolase [Gemmataceae bacterium]